jgi:hypothetical protein
MAVLSQPLTQATPQRTPPTSAVPPTATIRDCCCVDVTLKLISTQAQAQQPTACGLAPHTGSRMNSQYRRDVTMSPPTLKKDLASPWFHVGCIGCALACNNTPNPSTNLFYQSCCASVVVDFETQNVLWSPPPAHHTHTQPPSSPPPPHTPPTHPTHTVSLTLNRYLAEAPASPLRIA